MWSRLLRALWLLITGAISALALVLLASGRLNALDTAVSAKLLRVIPLQSLLVTIAKLGGDSLAYAVGTASRDVGLALWGRFFRKSVPLAVLTCAVVIPCAGLSVVVAMAICAAVLLDVAAVQMSADLNARGKSGISALATLLNYPLMVAVLWLVGLGELSVSFNGAVTAFVASSGCRFGWCAWWFRRRRGVALVQSDADSAIAVQQVLNYCVYRADQLWVGMGGLALFGGSMALEGLFLFLVRFPDIAFSGVSAAGQVFLPTVYSADRSAWRRSVSRTWALYVICVMPLALAVMTAFLMTRPGSESHWLRAFPFVCAATVCGPVIALTYSMVRAKEIVALNHCLIAALIFGMVVAGIAWATGNTLLLFWVVPIQLVVVVAAGCIIDWGDEEISEHVKQA